jgi:hypothetical protein
LLFKASPSPAYQALVKEAAQAPARESVSVVAEADGEELRLVGGGPELGDWDPKKAPRGKRQADGRFRFDLQLPARTTSAFKLVRVVDGRDEWEDHGNRFMTAGGDAPPLEIQFAQAEEVR